MKEIALTQGQVAMVDDEDYEQLSQCKWQAHKYNKTYYAQNSKKISMHREIMGNPQNKQIDHIDGNGLNNQKNNLRIVTSRQNHQNLHIERSSIYPGVSWRKDRRKWRSLIRINGKTVSLGHFENEIDAFDAYCDALKNINEVLIGT